MENFAQNYIKFKFLEHFCSKGGKSKIFGGSPGWSSSAAIVLLVEHPSAGNRAGAQGELVVKTYCQTDLVISSQTTIVQEMPEVRSKG